jgi:hypothetical protein
MFAKMRKEFACDSDYFRFFTGSPNDKAIEVPVGGGVAGTMGLANMGSIRHFLLLCP